MKFTIVEVAIIMAITYSIGVFTGTILQTNHIIKKISQNKFQITTNYTCSTETNYTYKILE
jgi:hypothetical protein